MKRESNFIVNEASYYDIPSGATEEERKRIIRKTINAANSRLRRIEEKMQKHYIEIDGVKMKIDVKTIPAYSYASQQLDRLGRSQVRFSFSKYMTEKELNAEYKLAKHFLHLKTSTIQGVVEVRLMQYEDYLGIAKSMGKELDLASFMYGFERAWNENLKQYYNSDQISVAAAIGKIDILYLILDIYDNNDNLMAKIDLGIDSEVPHSVEGIDDLNKQYGKMSKESYAQNVLRKTNPTIFYAEG